MRAIDILFVILLFAASVTAEVGSAGSVLVNSTVIKFSWLAYGVIAVCALWALFGPVERQGGHFASLGEALEGWMRLTLFAGVFFAGWVIGKGLHAFGVMF